MTNETKKQNEDRKKLKTSIEGCSLEEISKEQTRDTLPFFALGGIIEIGDRDLLLPLLDYLRFECFLKNKLNEMREFEQKYKGRIPFRYYRLELKEKCKVPSYYPMWEKRTWYEYVLIFYFGNSAYEN